MRSAVNGNPLSYRWALVTRCPHESLRRGNRICFHAWFSGGLGAQIPNLWRDHSVKIPVALTNALPVAYFALCAANARAVNRSKYVSNAAGSEDRIGGAMLERSAVLTEVCREPTDVSRTFNGEAERQ
jgi:hypothetical protein